MVQASSWHITGVLLPIKPEKSTQIMKKRVCQFVNKPLTVEAKSFTVT
jgi:hypothetical protein